MAQLFTAVRQGEILQIRGLFNFSHKLYEKWCLDKARQIWTEFAYNIQFTLFNRSQYQHRPKRSFSFEHEKIINKNCRISLINRK